MILRAKSRGSRSLILCKHSSLFGEERYSHLLTSALECLLNFSSAASLVAPPDLVNIPATLRILPASKAMPREQERGVTPLHSRIPQAIPLRLRTQTTVLLRLTTQLLLVLRALVLLLLATIKLRAPLPLLPRTDLLATPT